MKNLQNIDMEINWTKLDEYNDIIVSKLVQNLPSDYRFSKYELKSEVNETFVYLIKNFKSGELSLESYCWKYGYCKTLNRLLAEYHKAKSQIPLNESGEYEDDLEDADGSTLSHHNYGDFETEPYSRIQDVLEQKDAIRLAFDKANFIDKQIMKLIFKGLSYDEIATEIGISKSQITKRLKKYSL